MTSKYTKDQVDFLMEKVKAGVIYRDLIAEYNANPDWEDTTRYAIEHVVQKHSEEYGIDSKQRLFKGSRKTSSDDAQFLSCRDEVMRTFLEKVTEVGFIPTKAELVRNGQLDSRAVNKAFGSIHQLEAVARRESPEVFEGIIDENDFTDERFSELLDDVSEYQRFFITTAVTGCTPHPEGLKAVQAYCAENEAKLLIIPSSDGTNQKSRKYKFSMHRDLTKFGIVFQNLRLHPDLVISTVKLQAKQINPLTGLRRLAQDASCILTSPKQLLEAVASLRPQKGMLPHYLMTPGCITEPNYHVKSYLPERASHLAELTHVLGGIIVEIKDDETFFFRQVQIDPDTGAFTDLDRQYFPNGRSKKVRTKLIQLPDWHVGSTNTRFRNVAKEIVEALKPKFTTLEDFFDGSSINPHERRNIIQRNKRMASDDMTLEEELEACSRELSSIIRWRWKGKLIIKKGNHDNFLHRWLEEAEYASDPLNHYMGVCLAKAMLEGEEPIQHALFKRFPCDLQNRITFLKIDDSFMVDGIDNGLHGHIGAGGKRNPGLKGLEVYGPNNTGHTHASGILGVCWRSGTATDLQLSYNLGASAWSNTLLLQHHDKSRQLINVVNGEYSTNPLTTQP